MHRSRHQSNKIEWGKNKFLPSDESIQYQTKYNEICPSEYDDLVFSEYQPTTRPAPRPWVMRQNFPEDLASEIYWWQQLAVLKAHPRYNDLGNFSLIKRRKALAIIDDFNRQLLQVNNMYDCLVEIERSFARSNVNFKDPGNWAKAYWIAYLACQILYDIHTIGNNRQFPIIDHLRILCAPNHYMFTGGEGSPIPTVDSSSSDIYNFLNQFTKYELECVGY